MSDKVTVTQKQIKTNKRSKIMDTSKNMHVPSCMHQAMLIVCMHTCIHILVCAYAWNIKYIYVCKSMHTCTTTYVRTYIIHTPSAYTIYDCSKFHSLQKTKTKTKLLFQDGYKCSIKRSVGDNDDNMSMMMIVSMVMLRPSDHDACH